MGQTVELKIRRVGKVKNKRKNRVMNEQTLKTPQNYRYLWAEQHPPLQTAHSAMTIFNAMLDVIAPPTVDYSPPSTVDFSFSKTLTVNHQANYITKTSILYT